MYDVFQACCAAGHLDPFSSTAACGHDASLTYGDAMAVQQPAPPERTGTASTTGTSVTTVTSGGVDFHFPHAAGIRGVRLEVDWSLGRLDPQFRRVGDSWHLHLPRPAVDRMEYQFTVTTADGTGWATDPTNPATAENPFGDKSEVRFPEYRPPHWLDATLAGTLLELPTDSGALDCPVPTTLWSPDGLEPGDAAPLLLVNDGSDLADRGSLLRWATGAAQQLPFRVALVDPAPGLRDQWYAADPAYADHLASVVLPAVREKVTVDKVVGLGASLGALSILAAQRQNPELFDAMVLQSGSFFTAGLDPQESGYDRFAQVCAAVSRLVEGPAANQGPVLITCGAVEENRSNNEVMAKVLTAHGFAVEIRLVPDAHTMIGWRDAWSPGLGRVLRTVDRRRTRP